MNIHQDRAGRLKAQGIGVVMDPISGITIAKDSTFAMLLQAQARGWPVHYMEVSDLTLRQGHVRGRMRRLRVTDDASGWFELGDPEDRPLSDLPLVLMRKDPPFDMEYIYATYLLEQAEQEGTLVVNRPRSLRDANEKLFLACFPQCAPPTLVTRDAGEIRRFLDEQGDVVLKPLSGFGGAGVFRVGRADPNLNVIVETLTNKGRCFTMAQRYLPEIKDGDKRVLVVDGEAVPYALARVPRPGESRGNLAAGGTGIGVPLGSREHWIVGEVSPVLRRMGLLFVGLDIIGDYLTEINVTSPTCIRELDHLFGLNIAGDLLDRLESRLGQIR